MLDNLSDYPDSYSTSDSDEESDGSDIMIRKRRSVLPLRYSNSEDDDINTIEDNDGTWSINDKTIMLEPFEGSPDVKIMPSSPESLMDMVNLFIGNDFFEHLVRESNRYHYQIMERYRIISKTKK